MTFDLRPVTPSDNAFLLNLFGATKKRELDYTTLNKAQRQAFVNSQYKARKVHYEEFFADAEDAVIIVENRKIGRLCLCQTDEELRIIILELHPKYMKKELRQMMMNFIEQKGVDANIPVRVQVEKLSQWLDFMLERGYQKTDSTDTHFHLELLPTSVSVDVSPAES